MFKNKEIIKQNKIARNAAQTAVLMMILTLGSKLLGFSRELVMAGFFGTSYITDAYVMSQAIPTIIFAGFFYAVSVAYMPLFSKETEQKSILEGNRFTSEVINILIVASFFSILVGLLFSEQIVKIFASGFTGDTAELTAHFVKVTFSYVLFTSVTGILVSYLQYKNTFLPQILTGYIQNIIVIITIIISFYYSYYILAYGLLIANIIRLLILGLLSRNKGFQYKPTIRINNSIKKIIAMSFPIFIGSSVSQINSFVDKTLASGLQEGSVSALNYANLVIALITGLTVSILATIIYPKITQASSMNDRDRLNTIIVKGINVILIITIPFTLGAMVYNKEVVRAIYERGAFDQTATMMTSSALFYYAIGIVFMSVNTIITQVFYSQYNTRTPLVGGIFSVTVNIIMNLLLIGPMKHNGLALGTSISYLCNAIFLYFLIKKKYNDIVVLESWRKIMNIFLSSVVSVGISRAAYLLIRDHIVFPEIITLIFAVALAGLVYLSFLILFRIQELDLLKSILKRGDKSLD